MPQETREGRPYSEYNKNSRRRQSWDRHSDPEHRSSSQDHLHSPVSDNVSPISAPISPQISPLTTLRLSQQFEYQNFRPQPQHIYTDSDFTKEEARAVNLASPETLVAKRPITVTIRTRVPTPVDIPPHIVQNDRINQSTEELKDLGNHVDIQGWRRPSTVIIDGLSRWSETIYAVVYFIIPVLFLVLAISLATLHGRPTEGQKRWGVYLNWMQIAGTLYPIFFALLVGRALVKIAGCQLERGTTLLYLEQLMGSRTVSGAFDTQIKLRSFNILGFGLIILFILSPVGSQGFLRLLGARNISKTSSSTVSYFTTDTQSLFAQGNTIASDSVQSSIFRSLYTAAVLSPASVKMSPMDLWSNVKIPLQSSLTESNDDWTTISPNDTIIYSSLVGLPIGGLQNGETTLELESNYIELICSSPTPQSQPTYLTPFSRDSDAYSSPISSNNDTFYGASPDYRNNTMNTTATWSLGMKGFISPQYNSSFSPHTSSPAQKYCTPHNESMSAAGDQPYLTAPCALRFISPEQVQSSTLLFQSTGQEPVQATCTPDTIYVRSRILCVSTNDKTPSCHVTAQRPSTLSHAQNSLTALSFPEIFEAISLGLPRAFHSAGVDIINETGTDPSISYLTNADTSLASLIPDTRTGTEYSTSNIPPSLLYLPPATFSHHLSQLVNTYYTLSQAYPYITSPSSLSSLPAPTMTADVRVTTEVYRVSWPWFVFLVLGLVIMGGSSVLGTIVGRMSKGDGKVVEGLGFVSEILGTRSERDKDVRVRMGDGGRLVFLGKGDGEGERVGRDIV
ncbi:hypothetical protein HYFRA_00004718 [Hymenoscyphus fraxineus]|uniref:Uncharacterized protein n=1 Tax=Hymenoscyphus fraxineus TaxID=746836 RepID=A0A9N9KY97_9HELO|nr:hypothetical protein HYFRA_00004718 [Hymenoscyphus fraxineus]